MRVGWAIVVYGVLLAASIFWSFLRGDVNLFWPREGLLPAIFGLPLGLLLATVVVLLTRWSINAFPLMHELGRDFRALLGPMRQRDILIVAACSSIGEEAFFRGAMQPTLGLVAASLIFGLLHFGPIGRFSVWTFSAIAMGFALGAIYWLTGELSGVIAAHFVVNYFNLQLIRTNSFGISDPMDKLRWPAPRRRQTIR